MTLDSALPQMVPGLRDIYGTLIDSIIFTAPRRVEQAEYEDFYEVSMKTAADAFERAARFIGAVEQYLQIGLFCKKG